jgi:hypothetical protein
MEMAAELDSQLLRMPDNILIVEIEVGEMSLQVSDAGSPAARAVV